MNAGVVTQNPAASRLIPVSIQVGTSDPLGPQCDQSRQLLESRGHTVAFHVFSGGHFVDPTHALQAWQDMESHSLPAPSTP